MMIVKATKDSEAGPEILTPEMAAREQALRAEVAQRTAKG
jgi:hypothetical protein